MHFQEARPTPLSNSPHSSANGFIRQPILQLIDSHGSVDLQSDEFRCQESLFLTYFHCILFQESALSKLLHLIPKIIFHLTYCFIANA
jgi:hypothetical protein